MELFAEMVDCIQLSTTFAEHFILNVSQGYEYASNKTKQNPVAFSFISKKIRTSMHVSSFQTDSPMQLMFKSITTITD